MTADQITPPTVIVDNRTLQERFIANAKSKLNMASTWVMLIGGPLLSILPALWPSDAASQANVVQALGVSGSWKVLAPLFITWAFNAFKPPANGAVPAVMLAALQELAQQKLNATLVSMGHDPLPVKEAAVTAHPNVVLVGPAIAPAAAFVDTDPVQHVDIPVTIPPAPAQVVASHLTAVTQPDDPIAAVRQFFPGQTDDQIRALFAPKPAAPGM